MVPCTNTNIPSHAPTVTSMLLEGLILLAVKGPITEQAVVLLAILLERLDVWLIDVVDDDRGDGYDLQD